MIGQPSLPGICVSVLRFGGVYVNAGETPLCIDMAGAPWLVSWLVGREPINRSYKLSRRGTACKDAGCIRRNCANTLRGATRPRRVLDWNKKRQKGRLICLQS